jgi:hypothetical protein
MSGVKLSLETLPRKRLVERLVREARDMNFSMEKISWGGIATPHEIDCIISATTKTILIISSLYS